MLFIESGGIELSAAPRRGCANRKVPKMRRAPEIGFDVHVRTSKGRRPKCITPRHPNVARGLCCERRYPVVPILMSHRAVTEGDTLSHVSIKGSAYMGAISRNPRVCLYPCSADGGNNRLIGSNCDVSIEVHIASFPPMAPMWKARIPPFLPVTGRRGVFGADAWFKVPRVVFPAMRRLASAIGAVGLPYSKSRN